ncbi:TKL protein kinase [Saprolegnia parasitica CBS 223.65]|uniref:TKL protein kinase n=1 Tax=Saprolegnia parasitica (strain CBS 223.65) TaxID=695850 RepID=A0A067CWF1_SAPPC|nr:TKL protein kinase [Saprolegnia parasitica CBS 223.65]KDO33580.1 TKL protein kinase [Saprolegnia parasitica CBS 223.65]|eukprot:XP_012195633.1 TKL protein kinase [Saprolegnia parasitica CBS 223.65]
MATGPTPHGLRRRLAPSRRSQAALNDLWLVSPCDACPGVSSTVCIRSSPGASYTNLALGAYSCNNSTCDQCIERFKNDEGTTWTFNTAMWPPGAPLRVNFSAADRSTGPNTIIFSGTPSATSATRVPALDVSGLARLSNLYVQSLDVTPLMAETRSFGLPRNLTTLSLTDCAMGNFRLPSTLSTLQTLTIRSSTAADLNLTWLNASGFRSSLHTLTVENVTLVDAASLSKSIRHFHLTSLSFRHTNFELTPVSIKTFLSLRAIPSLTLDNLTLPCPYYAHKLCLHGASICVYRPKPQTQVDDNLSNEVSAWIVLLSMTLTMLYGLVMRYRSKRVPTKALKTRNDVAIESLLDTSSQQQHLSDRHVRPPPSRLYSGESTIESILQQAPSLHLLDASDILETSTLYHQGPHIHVAQGVYVPDGCRIQLKQIAGYESYLLSMARTIVDLAKLQHPHVAPLRGVVVSSPSSLAVVINDCSDNGPLLYERSSSLSEKATMARDLARALAYLHSAHIVHGHLTADTVLVDAGGDVYLNPLDVLASHVYATHSTDALYVAPEVLLESKATPSSDDDEGTARRVRFASPAADVYAFGVLLAEIDVGVSAKTYLTRKCLSFQDKKMPVAQLVGLRHALTFFRGQFQHVVALCLHEDPSSRPTMADVVEILVGPSMTMLEESPSPPLLSAS